MYIFECGQTANILIQYFYLNNVSNLDYSEVVTTRG